MRMPGLQTYEVVFPRKLHAAYKRDTQSIYPDVLQYEILLGGIPTIIHIEKTDDLFAENYTESRYLEDGTLVTSRAEDQDHCYYQGHVQHEKDSMVTLSTCNGLSGLIQTQEQSFYIEPLKFTDGEEHAVYEKLEAGNTTCGVSNDPLPRKPPSVSSFRASDVEKENLWSAKKYVELFMVADQSMYNKYDRDIQSVKQRLFHVVNYVNKVYKTINIFVALIGVEVWDSGDQIEVGSDYRALLQKFSDWRVQSLLPRKHHDNAQFITDVDFEGNSIGFAGVSAMCEINSAGVNQDHSSVVAEVGATVAHEMGHNLGMPHDKPSCTCGDVRCVMYASLGTEAPLRFSSCSINDMKIFVFNYFPVCMLNPPQMSQIMTPPVCGNKFIEGGEQCDCGEPQECKSKCCDAGTCRLRSGCQCDDDLCCQDCKIKPAGSICRPAKDDCDLTDMCDGKSAVCPQDRYKMNGSPCMEGEGACYRGKCPLIRSQCVGFWGAGVVAGSDECFRLNREGSIRGYCKNEGKVYIPCDKDAKCGLLYCTGGAQTPNIRGNMITSGQCKAIAPAGMVATGTKCSATNVCINGACSSIEKTYLTAGCDAKCTGHAVCDHDLQCHCEEGWAPPDCKVFIGTNDGSSLACLWSWRWTVLQIVIILLVTLGNN
ncbi:zinc metalloproteinase-disintegrin-like VAP1 isoform X2 [Engystomops pustulosus]|uniref:zinc metalloproteinase-disintegrin-like VAP1 isoform X2 n=1 Tax=Engystomops pustulosus TaxID=76066 RepID=UPI003AFB7D56